MNLINKHINHITWILNALKEQNKLLFQEIQSLMKDKSFLTNYSFQKYFYTYEIYLKIETSLEKGLKIMFINPPLKKSGMITLKNTYLKRCEFQFKEAGNYLKKSRVEIIAPTILFQSLYQKMKAIASLLTKLEIEIECLAKMCI